MMAGMYSMRRVTSMMLVPRSPARPVLPLLWMYVSQSLGASIITTNSTLLMSRPRAATSVATSVLNLPASCKVG